MKTDFSTATHTDYALESPQSLINKERFIMGVILPLSGGVSLYALTATGMMTYDILLKIFA